MAPLASKKRTLVTTVDKKIKDHSNDVFVQKKLGAAKKLIDKYGLPKSIKYAKH